MTTANRATATQLAHIIDVFSRIEWPARDDVIPGLFDAFGWTITNPPRFGVTDISVEFKKVSFTTTRGHYSAFDDCEELIEINFDVADVADPEDAAAKVALAEAFKAMVADVTGLLGKSKRSEYGRGSRMWDLPNGSRVHIMGLGEAVGMKLASKKDADLERREKRLGISPDRIPGEDQ